MYSLSLFWDTVILLKNTSQLDGATTSVHLQLISLGVKIMFSFLAECRVCLRLLNVKMFKDNHIDNKDSIYQHIIITFSKNPAISIFHSSNNVACVVCLRGVVDVHFNMFNVNK